MATQKTATELIRELKALEGKLHLGRCLCCKQPLRTYEQFGRLTGECTNRACRRVDVTMDLETLASLTNDDLDAMKYPDYSKKVS